MRLIANKPCSFGGRKFYIGDEIPADLVADVKLQEQYGVITVVNDGEVSGGQSGTFYTQEQLEKIVAEAVDEAVNNTVLEMEQEQKELQEAADFLQEHAAEVGETVPGAYEGILLIPVKGEGDNAMTVPVSSGEIQQVFSIMQLNAEEGARLIADVKSENVLILLHAADSRKMIKNAAKERAAKLFSTEEISKKPRSGNEASEPNRNGADA